MSHRKTTPERLALFSDAVFAVIITIMVMDLKPPKVANTEGAPSAMGNQKRSPNS